MMAVDDIIHRNRIKPKKYIVKINNNKQWFSFNLVFPRYFSFSMELIQFIYGNMGVIENIYFL